MQQKAADIASSDKLLVHIWLDLSPVVLQRLYAVHVYAVHVYAVHVECRGLGREVHVHQVKLRVLRWHIRVGILRRM